MPFAASGAHQDVLVVVGHADDFMRHDLADGKNQVEAALRNEPVDLRRPRIVELAFRLFADELWRNLAERLHIGAPVMDTEQIPRYIAEHVGDLVRPHGCVCAQRGKNRFEPVAVILPRIARQLAGAGVLAGFIGRYGKHAISLAELGHAFRKQVFQLERRQIGFNTTLGAVETHTANSTFLSPGANRTNMNRATR